MSPWTFLRGNHKMGKEFESCRYVSACFFCQIFTAYRQPRYSVADVQKGKTIVAWTVLKVTH